MHIILGILGTVVTILVLVNQLKGSGIDLGWLNPFSWAHRRRWRKKYNADPAFMIKSPMEAAAGLLYVAAKCTGEMTQEEKSFMLNAFENSFNLSNRESSDLLSSCSFILKDEDEILNKVDKFLQPSLESFSDAQKESTLALVTELSNLAESPTEKQSALIKSVSSVFYEKHNQEKNW